MAANEPSAIIAREYELAWAARRAGNEGRARVCARRAAGWAVRLSTDGRSPGRVSGNVLRRLEAFSRDPEAAIELRQAAARLTTRLSPDHQLPHLQDPLEDARLIIEACLPGAIPPAAA